MRHTVIKACRDFFDSRGFTLIDTPILSSGIGLVDQLAATLILNAYLEAGSHDD